jgi:hypothetical protein
MFFALLLTVFLFFSSPILSSANQFGLHLTQTSDLNSATSLINSNGGDWGWITIVIRNDQLDYNNWQKFFDQCRQFHLIPILRLATYINPDGTWDRPQEKDIDSVVTFLNSLNWPTQKRHLILYNEINHASEWGGKVDIKSFVEITGSTIKKLKQTNPDFYILSTPLDLASPDSLPNHLSAPATYRQILELDPSFFDQIDGLASHSYPNHGFIGLPTDTGQHSILGYQWELNFLKSLGVNKRLPVFITETGWPHRQGQQNDNKFYTTETTAKFFQEALLLWNQDPIILAVTPFIYNYSDPPFDHFSWLDPEQKLYPEYQTIIDLPKTPNHPKQITRFQAEKIKLPFIIFSQHQYLGKIILKNTGQSIWGGGETFFCLKPQTTANIKLDQICTNNQLIFPGQSQTFDFNFEIVPSSDHSGKSFLSWQNLPPFSISPIADNSSIYRPKISFFQKIKTFFARF